MIVFCLLLESLELSTGENNGPTVDNVSLLRPFVYRTFASTFQTFVNRLEKCNNCSSRLSQGPMTYDPLNYRQDVPVPSLSSLGCDWSDPSTSSFDEPVNDDCLYDAYEPKVEAWRAALCLARLIFCTDIEIVAVTSRCDIEKRQLLGSDWSVTTGGVQTAVL